MGIHDRDYVFKQHRQSAFGHTPVTVWLIVINVAVFVMGWFMANFAAIGTPRYMSTSSLLTTKQRVENNIQDKNLKQENGYRRAAFNAETGKLQPVISDFADSKETSKLNNIVFRLRKDPASDLWVYADQYVVEDYFTAWGHFSTARLLAGEVWRLITFQFLHASIMHILFNMMALWIFGRVTEERMGSSSRYLAFYLICGLSGGLMYLMLNGLGTAAAQIGFSIPGLLPGSMTAPLVGASAGVFGVMMSAAYLEPRMQLALFGFIPVSIRALAYGSIIIAALTVLFRWNNAGGEAAHIGGAIAGFFFIRRSHLLKDFFAEFTDLWDRVRGLFGGKKKLRIAQDSRPKTLREVDPELDAQVDKILVKYREQGPASLSTEELAILKRATDMKK